jgi:hypothetical protein
MESSLIGAWDLETNENINEYLKELGNINLCYDMFNLLVT